MKYILPFLLLLFFACTKQPEIISENKGTSYLALGDSYTIGESVDYAMNYPNQLYAKLVAEDIAIEAPKIIAQTGWTTLELAAAIQQENPDSNYALVSLSIGVNNQFRGYAIAGYEANFEELLKQAIAFAGGDNNRVFVISIPDYGYTPFGQRRSQETISRELDEYNAINKRISETYEVTYFDITPISREGLIRTDLVAVDDLHPSAKQYQEWIELMYKEVKEKMLMK